MGIIEGMVLGLVLGMLASWWVIDAARDHTLAATLASPGLTACLGLGIVAVGWVMAHAASRFTAAFAGLATVGTAYGAIALAADGDRLLAYGWSTVPVSLGCLAFGAGFHSSSRGHRPWSTRRATAPRVPRLRAR